MTVRLQWFLPTADLDHLTQIAKAAEHLGFEAALTPTGR